MQQPPALRDVLPVGRRNWADIQDSPFSSQEASDSPPAALPLCSQGSCGPEASQHSETGSQRALRQRLECVTTLVGSSGSMSPPMDAVSQDDVPITEDLLTARPMSQRAPEAAGPGTQAVASSTIAPAASSDASSPDASACPLAGHAADFSTNSNVAFTDTILPSITEESTTQEQGSRQYDIHHLFSVATAKVPAVCKAAATPQRRRSSAQKRQGCVGGASVQTPQGKRPRPSLAAAVPALPPKDPELPEEEVWQRRQGKRENAIVGVKKSREYKDFEARRSRGEFAGKDIPLTPDPTDETVSKRKWEGNVMVWRNDLKALFDDSAGLDDLEEP